MVIRVPDNRHFGLVFAADSFVRIYGLVTHDETTAVHPSLYLQISTFDADDALKSTVAHLWMWQILHLEHYLLRHTVWEHQWFLAFHESRTVLRAVRGKISLILLKEKRKYNVSYGR